jgi:hypothetical protein
MVILDLAKTNRYTLNVWLSTMQFRQGLTFGGDNVKRLLESRGQASSILFSGKR